MEGQSMESQIIVAAKRLSKKRNKFVDLFERNFENLQDHEKASLFLNIAKTLFDHSFFNLGIYCLEHALMYYIKIDDTYGKSACYTNLGIIYGSMGEYNKTIEYENKALPLKRKLLDKKGESNCYLNLGNAYLSLDDYTKSIEHQEKALAISIQIEDQGVKSICYLNLGNCYGSLGNYSKSVEYHKKALAIKKYIRDRTGESLCYLGLGSTYRNLGNYSKAIEYHKKALAISKEIDNRQSESSCYVNLGSTAADVGNYSEAIQYYKKALKISIEIDDKDSESFCNLLLGNAHGMMGDNKKAIEYFKRALIMAKEQGDKLLESSCYTNMGIYYEGRRPEIAYEYLKKSIELTDIIGKEIVEEDLRMDFYGVSTLQAYEHIVQVCLKLDNEKEAFEYTERSKSKTFLHMLAASNIRPSVPKINTKLKQLLSKEEKYLIRLRQFQTRRLNSDTAYDEVLGTIDGKGVSEIVDDILSKLNKIYDMIESIDREYVFIRRASPLPFEKIQEILLHKERYLNGILLVEYFIANETIIIFVISSHDFHTKVVQLSSEKLLYYIQNLEKKMVGKPGDSVNSWLELSRYLIEPISEYLSSAYAVCFVPFGLLHYIPFHALELNGKPLIRTHAVTYSPSASLLQFYKNKGTGFLKSCASFGIVFNEEAQKIADIFHTKPYLNATRENVMDNIKNDILHFSCHGNFNEKDPLSSGIQLRDDVLTAREILGLSLKSELVTLSACETGISESKPGDELIGLTRSLLYAGAASVVVSLWSVDAYSTQELMHEFYKELKNGVDKPTALQQAQIKIMQKAGYSDPYYWAPFILIEA